MLDNRTMDTTVVLAGVMWAFTVALYIIAGVLMATGHWKAAIFIAEAACGTAAYAAVRHLRIYAGRICSRIDDVSQLDADIRRMVPSQPRTPSRN